jgi:hypothetical protein
MEEKITNSALELAKYLNSLFIKKDKFNTDSSEGIKIITACSRIISAINKNKLKIKYHGKR